MPIVGVVYGMSKSGLLNFMRRKEKPSETVCTRELIAEKWFNEMEP